MTAGPLFPTVAGVIVRPGTPLSRAQWIAPLGPNSHRNLEVGHRTIADVHDMGDEDRPDDLRCTTNEDRFRWTVRCSDYTEWARGYADSWEAAMACATRAATWSAWGVVDPPRALLHSWSFLWDREQPGPASTPTSRPSAARRPGTGRAASRRGQRFDGDSADSRRRSGA